MQNRERGAAHINIYFFLVLLVLFLGTLWFGYINMAEVNGARKEAAIADVNRINAELQVMIRDHYIEEISKVIGETGAWGGQKGFNYETRLKSKWVDQFGVDSVPTIQAPKSLSGVTLPDQVKTKLDNLAKNIGLSGVSASPIGPFFGQVADQHTKSLQKVTAAEAAVATERSRAATLQNTFRASDAQHTQKLAAQQQGYTKNMNDFRNANTQQAQRLQSAQGEVKAANQDMDKLRDDHQVVVKKLQKESERNHGQLAALKALNAQRRPPQQADGSVISASMRASRGWIDIGRKDMLVRGTKFKITNPAGTKVKGYGEVIQTKQDRAELRLYNVADKVSDPITKGDQLYNELYSPNMKRNVAMIGRFSYPYTKPMIKKILEQLGNTVHDEVKVGVDMVIVGLQSPTESGDALMPIEETPGYKQAQVLHCDIVTISKIRDLLQLGDN